MKFKFFKFFKFVLKIILKKLKFYKVCCGLKKLDEII